MSNVFMAYVDSILCKRRVEDALACIEKCKPHIHRIAISVPHTKWANLRKLSPNFKQRANQGKRATKYRKTANFTLKGKNTRVFFDPIMGCLPSAIIEVTSPTPKFLRKVLAQFPNALVSRVEYSLDFMCSSPTSVAKVLWLLRRYCYLPYCTGGVSVVGGPCSDGMARRSENSVCRFLKRGKRNGHSMVEANVYERGANSHARRKGKSKKCWAHSDTDRVRLEFILSNSKNRTFPKLLGSNMLASFYAFPKMALVLERKFRFAAFKGSSQLPSEWERYREADRSGGKGCFQMEYIRAKRLGLNQRQYMYRPEIMQGLSADIEQALQRYDRKWKAAVSCLPELPAASDLD